MDIVKLLTEQGLVNGTFILFIISIFIYFPRLIKQHFTELKETREEYSNNLKDITNKFVNQLEKMTAQNNSFFKDISQEQQKHYTKLEEIHSEIKSLKK